MNWRRFALAAVGGFVALFGFGAVWHLLLFPGLYTEVMQTMRAAGPMIFAVNVVRALLLAYIFPVGFKGGAVWMEGLRFGVLMGLLAGLPVMGNLLIVGQTQAYVWVELVFIIIQGAINGVVVAAIYGSAAGKAA